jgi:hypothetical protein
MSRGLNEAQVDALADRLRGTTDSLSEAMEDLELPDHDHDGVEHQLAAVNVEKCNTCDSWCDTSDLEPDDDDAQKQVCSDCR